MKKGITFLNRNKQPFTWDNKDEEETLMEDEKEPEMAPIQDFSAEMPRMSLERHQLTSAVSEDEKQDDNEEAAAAKKSQIGEGNPQPISNVSRQ